MLLEPAGPLPLGPVTVHSPIQKSNRCRSGTLAHGVGALAGADACVAGALCAISARCGASDEDSRSAAPSGSAKRSIVKFLVDACVETASGHSFAGGWLQGRGTLLFRAETRTTARAR